jgi:hypothetical protein
VVEASLAFETLKTAGPTLLHPFARLTTAAKLRVLGGRVVAARVQNARELSRNVRHDRAPATHLFPSAQGAGLGAHVLYDGKHLGWV